MHKYLATLQLTIRTSVTLESSFCVINILFCVMYGASVLLSRHPSGQDHYQLLQGNFKCAQNFHQLESLLFALHSRWQHCLVSATHYFMSCRAPMSFFHVTPVGRIINRLTKDTSDVDKNLADFAAFFLRSCLQLFSTIVLVGVTTPFALPFLVPILLLFYFLYQYFQVILFVCG